MLIRKFKPEDAEAVSKVMIKAFKTFLKDKMSKWELKSFSPEVLKEVSNVKREDSETVSYVAEDKGKIIGYISGSATGRGLGSLGVVGVEPSCLHKGVGTKLMKELEKFWRQKKMRKISTSVSAHNTRALIYYIKNGFIPVGYRKDHFIVGVDEIILDRFIVGVDEIILDRFLK